MYDIIGDVHGYAALLKKLLKKLGYKKGEAGYSHPSRKAVFVGDFINRGPDVRETVQIIRKMAEAGNAVVILGNHELNAIMYYLKDESGGRIMQKNIAGFFKTKQDFHLYPDEWKSHRKWMRTLPLVFEDGLIRVVHACWNDENIRNIKGFEFNGKWPKELLRKIYNEPDSPEGKSVWQTTKGLYFDLPKDLTIRNNKKASIRSFRLNWWEPLEGKTFNGASFESKFLLPEYTIPPEILPVINPYPENAPIVFFGHYCRGAGPLVIRPNICCVDSCITSTRTLSAYSWQGEDCLTPQNIISVN